MHEESARDLYTIDGRGGGVASRIPESFCQKLQVSEIHFARSARARPPCHPEAAAPTKSPYRRQSGRCSGSHHAGGCFGSPGAAKRAPAVLRSEPNNLPETNLVVRTSDVVSGMHARLQTNALRGPPRVEEGSRLADLRVVRAAAVVKQALHVALAHLIGAVLGAAIALAAAFHK